MTYNMVAPASQIDEQSIKGQIVVQALPTTTGKKALASNSIVGERTPNSK